jgi:Concanavalin A-like lectin/glucanases superfamily
VTGPRFSPAWRTCLVIGMGAAGSGCELLYGFGGFGGDSPDAAPADGADAVSDGSAFEGSLDTGSARNDGGAADASDANAIDSAARDAPAGDSAASDSGGNSDGGRIGPCMNDLSNILAGDFTVAVQMNTTQSGPVAVLNQRSVCNSSVFWDLQLQVGGAIQIETDAIANYDRIRGSIVVADGKTHDIVVKRVSEQVTIYVDGKPDPSGQGASLSSFQALAAIAVGTDVCDSPTGLQAFKGTLTDVCVSSP